MENTINEEGDFLEPFFCLSGQDEIHTALGSDAQCPAGKYPGTQPADGNDCPQSGSCKK